MSSKRHLAVVSILVLAAVFVAGLNRDSSPLHDNTFNVVRAKTFELLDARGDRLLVLTAMPEGYPGVLLAWRDDPEAFASITVPPSGEVMISVNDLKRRATAGVSLGGFDAGRITVGNARHGTTAVLGVEGDGAVVVSTPSKRPE